MGLVRCAALGISGHREKPGEDFSTALRGCRFDPRPVSRSMGLSDRMTNCSGIWATNRLSVRSLAAFVRRLVPPSEVSDNISMAPKIGRFFQYQCLHFLCRKFGECFFCSEMLYSPNLVGILPSRFSLLVPVVGRLGSKLFVS